MDTRSKNIQEIFRTSAVVQRMMRTCLLKDFEEMGVAPSQLQLLQLIEQQQPVSLKLLAASMHLTPGAITQLVEGLVRAGYVTRTESSEDRRVMVVTLTPEGAKVGKTFERRKQEILTEIVANMTDDELEIFLRVQQKMLTHLETYCTTVKK